MSKEGNSCCALGVPAPHKDCAIIWSVKLTRAASPLQGRPGMNGLKGEKGDPASPSGGLGLRVRRVSTAGFLLPCGWLSCCLYFRALAL